jgi:hypothetical protein
VRLSGLRQGLEATVEVAPLRRRQRNAPFLQAPAGEPIDAALDCQLGGINQKCDGRIGVSVTQPCRGEVDEHSEPRVRRMGHGKGLLQEYGCGWITQDQEGLPT